MGNYKEAIAYFSQAIKFNNKLVDACNNRSNSRPSFRDNRGEIIDYDQAIKLKPNLPDTYNNQGNAYSALGNYWEAISNYREIVGMRLPF
ncbi:MAG: tetratricopeptide repeat protein [Okeania sp. SIO1H6]|nr:tetratricopeptide repeat protein [Okeania sp. SIO1H6]